MRSCTSLAGRLESHQRGFWIETPFQMQKTKAWRWLFPGRNILIFGGTCSGNTRGKTWLDLAHQISAAWPCHRWNSSPWPPAGRQAEDTFLGQGSSWGALDCMGAVCWSTSQTCDQLSQSHRLPSPWAFISMEAAALVAPWLQCGQMPQHNRVTCERTGVKSVIP